MQSHYTKLLRATLTASLMLVAMAGAAVAGPLEDAVAASERHDYRTALRLFRLLAEQGNAIAQSALGYMHETGEGVPQDYIEAAKWYRLAGEQGDALAQTRLGFMYEMGKGVSQNFAEAAKWLRLAAEQAVSLRRISLAACTSPAEAYQRTMSSRKCG
jgi:TPR repeat protein